MQDATHRWLVAREKLFGASFRKAPNANEPLRLENLHDATQMLVARVQQREQFGCGQLVGCAIAAAGFHERQRAVIDDKMAGEESLRPAKALGKQAPKSSSADFGARTVEAENGAFGMWG